jgi:hypothetical protein
MIAPFPCTDLDNDLILLIALKTAKTFDPHYKLYGAATKVEIGIGQILLDVI